MIKHQINICLKTPLHIGNGDKLTSVGEYIATNHKIRIIDQEHLISLLDKKGSRQKYLDFIINHAENSNVWSFFINEGIEKYIKFIREIPFNTIDSFNPASNNLLELAIETCGHKYIPGSSLKGAIRTIIFTDLISKDRSLKSNIENIIRSTPDLLNIKKKLKKIEDDRLNVALHFLQIEDSQPATDDDVVVETAKRVHLFGVKSEGLDNLRECIGINARMKTVISIQDQLLNNEFNYLKTNEATGLFNVINRITENLIDYDISLLKKSNSEHAKIIIKSLGEIKNQASSSNGQSALLRLGKGKSFFFQVILPFLLESAQKRIINLMGKDREGLTRFPQTRVLSGHNLMFGWITLEQFN